MSSVARVSPRTLVPPKGGKLLGAAVILTPLSGPIDMKFKSRGLGGRETPSWTTNDRLYLNWHLRAWAGLVSFSSQTAFHNLSFFGSTSVPPYLREDWGLSIEPCQEEAWHGTLPPCTTLMPQPGRRPGGSIFRRIYTPVLIFAALKQRGKELRTLIKTWNIFLSCYSHSYPPYQGLPHYAIFNIFRRVALTPTRDSAFMCIHLCFLRSQDRWISTCDGQRDFD